MTTETSRIETHPPITLRQRAQWVLTRAFAALLWLGFVWFGTLVIYDSPIDEVLASVLWLAQSVAGYLVLLTLWIGYNIALYKFRGPRLPIANVKTVFAQDYFGRPVVLTAGAGFKDEHLIVELHDGMKVYRNASEAELLPDTPERQTAPAQASTEAVGETMAAAAGS